ncbi:hypothetical protein QJS10_CPA08g01925 [Acorus calamus]|uniref:Uncharacterized protein n=1 Tax=Acorus calamus TaxID=4465 RepID=A0AAV9EAZ9_ACOCL|nr:hypothetical protein QJS10_CPA08g01925 [Acorus calamus]
MLSFEVPPDPSCSPNLSGLKTDERAQEGLALKGAKEEHHLHCFSIRDYVFTSRRNDIQTNWPFSEKSLQLCLKHGVHDLLPPFKPPDLLRSHIFRNIVRSDCRQDQSVLASLGPSESLPLESKSNANRKAKNLCKSSKSSPSTDQLTLQKAKNSISEASPNSGRVTAPCLSSKNEKKVRLIVKLSTVSDYSRTEDIASNSSSITDTMASKVCPVCKTFSSTSNTTLNAHIDQCLAEESNAKEVVAKPVKHKVKPRKIRLMVDIIATAPRCTLEYLDRRNGSNWALDPTLVAPANDVCTESKRPKLIPEDIDDDDDGNEGAVYLDANGRKIRILSKFNDAPLATVKEDSKQMKDVKETKEGKSNLVGKKKIFSKKYSKYLEVRSHGKKKLRSFKAYRSEVHKTTERNNPLNDNEREESQSRVLTSQDTTRTSELGPLKKWGCSKRTHILKKSRSKDAHMRLRPLGPVAEDESREGIRPNSDSSVVRSHIVKFLRSSEVQASSPRSKSLSNLVQKMNSGEKHLEPTKTIITSKFAGDLGDFESSPRSKGVEIHAGSPPDKHESSRNHHPFLLKAKNLSMLTKNTSFGRPPSHEKNSASKKFRKLRSTVESNKRCMEVSLDASDEDGSAKGRHLDKFDSPKMVKTVEKVSSGKAKMSAPKQGKEERFAPEKMSADVGITQFGHVNANHELLNVDAQVVAPNDSGSTILRVHDFVKDHPPSSDVLLGHTRSNIGTETEGDTLWQRSSDDNETSNRIVGQDNQSAMENVNYGETVTDAPSIQGLDVASPTADVPHENSSITSSGHLSAQNQSMQVDEEPSGSSFSATSTVSPTSTPRSAFRYLESDNSFGGHFLLQDKPSLSPLNNKSLLKMDMEIPRQEMPCCCSRKEEASPRYSNPLRKISCSETMLHPTDKLLMGSSSNARMSISTPFGALPTVRMEGLSVNIMPHSEATFKFPTRSDIGSASPSSRAQTVRLMGKDLTVATQDGEDDMMNVPNTPVTASSNHMNSKYLSLLGYPNPNPSLNQDYPYFHGVSSSRNSDIHQSMWVGGGGRSTAYDCMDTSSQQQRSMHEKLSSAFDYNMERTTSEAAVHAREVIIIDDSSDPRSQVRAFSCLPSQDMFLPKQSDGVNLMIHPRSCPNGMSNNTTRRGDNSECSSNILSRPFILSSPSHFYSPTF